MKKGKRGKVTPRVFTAQKRAALIRRYKRMIHQFDLIVEYHGHNAEADRAIELLAGKQSSGSGYWVGKDTRDLSFEFPNEDAAKRAKARICYFMKVRVKLKSCKRFAEQQIKTLQARPIITVRLGKKGQ